MDDKTPPYATESNLDTAKRKLGTLAEKAKQRDFKGDVRKAAEGVKDLRASLKKHDFKSELKDAFAEAKKSPASLWRKPESPRPGKELAVVGLAAAVGSFLITAVTSSSFLGFLCLLLGLGALLFSLLGLKTEGRKLAVGGTVVGLLVVFCSLGQMFGSSTDGEENEEEITVASTMPKEKLENNGESKADEEYPLLIPNEGEEASSVEAILEQAENARRIRSVNFCGFYTGMSYKNAKLLCEHYGLDTDDFKFSFNHQSGEVFEIKFSTRAIGLILDVANNFETAELAVQGCLGIVAWNNERAVEKGQVDSIFQDEGEKMLIGDAADVERIYKTADGVLVKMYPKVWNRPGKMVFSIWDPRRGKAGEAVNPKFSVNNKMREAYARLKKSGIPVKIIILPSEIELLMKMTDKEGVWTSEYPILKSQWESIMGPITDKDKKDTDAISVYDNRYVWGSQEHDVVFWRASDKKVVHSFDMCQKLNELSSVKQSGFTFYKTSINAAKNVAFLVAETQEGHALRLASEKAEKDAKEFEEQKRIAEEKDAFKTAMERMATMNNEQCEKAKAILNAANIETISLELDYGVKLLMTKVVQKNGTFWVGTYPINEVQWNAGAVAVWKRLSSDKDTTKWLEPARKDLTGPKRMVLGLNERFEHSGWHFYVPDTVQWDRVFLKAGLLQARRDGNNPQVNHTAPKATTDDLAQPNGFGLFPSGPDVDEWVFTQKGAELGRSILHQGINERGAPANSYFRIRVFAKFTPPKSKGQ